MGRIHMVRQDYKRLQTRKMKGLKKTLAEKKEQRQRSKVNKRINPNNIPLGKMGISKDKGVKKGMKGPKEQLGKSRKRQNMVKFQPNKKRVRFE